VESCKQREQQRAGTEFSFIPSLIPGVVLNEASTDSDCISWDWFTFTVCGLFVRPTTTADVTVLPIVISQVGKLNMWTSCGRNS